MASYLSYFTSGTTNAQSQSSGGHGGGSTWSTTFSSRIATLRKALTKDTEEDDPENEDCSHVSNVLRAYYTEKGRTFPEWLPPDPSKPAPNPPQAQYAQYRQYGAAPSNQYGAAPAHGRGGSAGRVGLSDLWDPTPSTTSPPTLQSLRPPRPTPQSLRSQDSTSSQLSGAETNQIFPQSSFGARPLPSQKVGSFQDQQISNMTAMGSKDRLRARLQGGGSGRNSPASGGGRVSYSTGEGYDAYNANGSSYVSASEPWSNTGQGYNNDTAPAASNPYGSSAYRQRPGGPR